MMEWYVIWIMQVSIVSPSRLHILVLILVVNQGSPVLASYLCLYLTHLVISNL